MAALLLAAILAPPWPQSLYVSWGPHLARVPVVILNRGSAAVEGDPVGLLVGPGPGELDVAGQPLSAIRVADEQGLELLWAATDSGGSPLRTGTLAPGDTVHVPATCGPGESRTLYVYFDNPGAWPVPDYLATGLWNRGFSEGTAAGPLGWQAHGTDAQHVMSWSADGGIGGSACAVCSVSEGAPPTWVQYSQRGLPVRAGVRYRLSGWVRAESCAGTVGWYVHVDGDQPMLVNEVLDAGAGTYGWTLVQREFVTPESSVSATIGTVLHGTGTAWYDDVSLEPVGPDSAVEVSVGPVERANFEFIGEPDPVSGWGVTAVNADAAQDREVLVLADTRPAVLAWRREHGDYETPVSSEVGVGTRTLEALGGQLFTARLPARSVVTFPVSVGPAPGGAAVESHASGEVARLAQNIVPGALFDSPADLAAWGPPASEGPESGCRAELSDGGVSGTRCMRLTVPREAAPHWVGVRQSGIALRPGASYYYGGFIRAGELGGTVRLHAHVRDSDGQVLSYISTTPSVGSGSDWTWTATVFRVPAAGSEVELHLTMDTWGTAYYDGIALVEVVQALPIARAGGPESHAQQLEIGIVDPLVKTFRDDRVRPANRIEVAAARNEYEPIQVAVRLPWGTTEARVEVEPPTGPDGFRLPSPTMHQVGYVPVDAPTSYYITAVPAYARKIPVGSVGSDGWPGWWPDPLVPLTDGRLYIGESQPTIPVWATFYVPEDAPPGQYQGRLVVTAGSETKALPLDFTVWGFTLPRETHTRAIYDLRDGPIGSSIFGSDDVHAAREAWYRMMAEHRVCPDTAGPDPAFRFVDGRVSMDTTDFDRWAELCLDELGMNSFYTPWIFYGLGWAYRPSQRFGLEPLTPEWTSALAEAYRLFIEHITERGWRGKLIHYVSDEPHFVHAHVVEDLQRYCAIFGEVAPDVPRYSSTWRPCEELEGAITMWGAGHYGCFPVAKMAERIASGDRVLFTTDGQMCTDTPYCAVERLLPHYAFHYGAEGYEFWGVSWWTYDPWDWGWHAFISQSDEGNRYYWVRYPNGDGYLAYPGGRYGVNGPLPSMRLAQAREGLEDGEYLHLLASKIEELRHRGAEVAEAQEALAEAAALVPIPNAGGVRSSEVLPDPGAVSRVRSALAKAILACDEMLSAGPEP